MRLLQGHCAFGVSCGEKRWRGSTTSGAAGRSSQAPVPCEERGIRVAVSSLSGHKGYRSL